MPRLTHRDLPSETLFIFDGTAMLYQCYHGSEAKSTFQDAIFSESFKDRLLADLPHLVLPSAPELSAAVVEPLTDGSDPYFIDSSLPLPCTALSSMMMTFARFVRDLQPSYLAVAFDTGRNFRCDLMPSYKAHRPKTPIELIPQLYAAPQVLEMVGVPVYQQPGFEADDVMASLGRWARQRGLHVVHVSVDKDMLQLVEEGVHVMHPFTLQLLGSEDVVDKFGVEPEAFIDYLAICGDAVDNIPGAPGIGPKTAQLLLNNFSSLEALMEALDLRAAQPHLPTLLTRARKASPRGKDSEGEANDSGDEEKKPRKRAPKWSKEDLREVLGAEQTSKALNTLMERASVSPTKALSIYSSLLAAGADQLLLYRDLATLRRDLALKGLDGSLPSSKLRFRGERPFQAAEVEQLVEDVSLALSRPLALLRQQYHRLDRS